MNSSQAAKNYFLGRKVLLIGLGALGGGVATANWLLKQGAKLTVTDLKSAQDLRESLAKIKGRVKLVLGENRLQDIDKNEIVVINPDVPAKSELVKRANEQKKEVWNEATIFFEWFDKPIAAVTGTRGKTTTVWWLNHFLKTRFKSSLVGNSSDFQFLKILPKAKSLEAAVVELPSYHLELFNNETKPPLLAVMTNIYRDHLNRHKTEENYARIKAKIFASQTAADFLVLNADDRKTPWLLKLKPKAAVYFFSGKKLLAGKNGVFYDRGGVYWREAGVEKKLLAANAFLAERGEHNLYNLLASALAAYLMGVTWLEIKQAIKSLPEVPWRQETIFTDGKLKIINDTTATSPEGGMAAIKRFGRQAVLIAGGTDRELDFKAWASTAEKNIGLKNIVFLAGSATEKMLKALKVKKEAARVEESLEECFKEAQTLALQNKKSVILFSPAAKSFEKFKHEYDRGKQFTSVVKKVMRRKKNGSEE